VFSTLSPAAEERDQNGQRGQSVLYALPERGERDQNGQRGESVLYPLPRRRGEGRVRGPYDEDSPL